MIKLGKGDLYINDIYYGEIEGINILEENDLFEEELKRKEKELMKIHH